MNGMKVSTFVLSLLICISPAHAQSKSAAMEAYLKWRDQSFARLPSGINTPHYALAATVRRLDAQSLQIDFVVVGQIPAYSLEIQPLRIGESSNVRRQEKAGELTTSSLSGIGETNALNPLSQMTVTVLAGAEANAIEVTWKFRAAGEQMAPTFTIHFETDAPSTGVLGIAP